MSKSNTKAKEAKPEKKADAAIKPRFFIQGRDRCYPD